MNIHIHIYTYNIYNCLIYDISICTGIKMRKNVLPVSKVDLKEEGLDTLMEHIHMKTKTTNSVENPYINNESLRGHLQRILGPEGLECLGEDLYTYIRIYICIYIYEYIYIYIYIYMYT
jgi:hypothetical protein